MEDESVVPAAAGRKKPFILFRLIQWIAFSWSILILLTNLATTEHLSLPGASIALFTCSVASALLLVGAHAPPVFFRLLTKLKVAAYGGLIIPLVLAVSSYEQVQSVWEKTPAGQKELAAKAAADAAFEARRQKQQQAEAEKVEADLNRSREQAEAAGKLQACKDLIPEVTKLASEKQSVEIIEINDIKTEDAPSYDWKISCSGRAITDRGSGFIDFHTETTPQGNVLLNLKFPFGIE